MKLLALFAFFIVSLHARATTCLVELEPAPAERLGIGVLIEDAQGGLFIGTSPYAGSVHSAIVAEMAERTALSRILWMGEIRFRIEQDRPLILEANESSGYYTQIRESGLTAHGRSVPVLNDVAQIPAELRAWMVAARFPAGVTLALMPWSIEIR